MTIRETYLAAAAGVVSALEHPALAESWTGPSALERMSVGELAAHLARSLHQVEAFLDAPDPASPNPIRAEAYIGDLADLADLDSPVNVGVRRRSQDGAAAGPDGVARRARQTWQTLSRRLPEVSAERQLMVFGDQPMRVDEYLRTRLVEFAVHHDDLRTSLPDDAGQDLGELPDGARAVAIEVLVGVARRRHGDLAVLRALARRERDPDDVLRVI